MIYINPFPIFNFASPVRLSVHPSTNLSSSLPDWLHIMNAQIHPGSPLLATRADTLHVSPTTQRAPVCPLALITTTASTFSENAPCDHEPKLRHITGYAWRVPLVDIDPNYTLLQDIHRESPLMATGRKYIKSSPSWTRALNTIDLNMIARDWKYFLCLQNIIGWQYMSAWLFHSLENYRLDRLYMPGCELCDLCVLQSDVLTR